MRELDNRLMRHIDLLVERYPSLESAKNDIVAAYLLLEESYENGGKLLVAGNGGSAADAEHIVGELMKGFKLPRKPEADFAEKLVEENQELGSVLAENLQGALPAIALDGPMHTGTEKKTAISWFVCIRMTPVHLNADRSLFLWKMTALAFPKKSRNIFSSVFIRLIHPAPEQAPVLVCPWFNRSPNFIMEQ